MILHRLERTGLEGLSTELERDVRAVYAKAPVKKRTPSQAEREAAEAMEFTLSAIQTSISVFDAAGDDETIRGTNNIGSTPHVVNEEEGDKDNNGEEKSRSNNKPLEGSN